MSRFGVVVLTALIALGCSGSSKCANADTCGGGSGALGGAGGVSVAGASTEGGKSNSDGGSAGGSSPSSGGAGGSSAGGVTSSAGNGPIAQCPPECLVAVTCVDKCGGMPKSVGCCPCVTPAFDQRTCP